MPKRVPTVPELAEMGEDFAVATDWVNDGTAVRPKWRATRWRVTAKGHAAMGAAMRENALEALARGEGEWTRPPSRTDLGALPERTEWGDVPPPRPE